YEQRRHDLERPLLPPGDLYLAPDGLRERLNQGQRVEVLAADDPKHGDAQPLPSQPAPDLPLVARDAAPAAALKDFLASYPGQVLVAADTAGRREALLEVMQAANLEVAVLPPLPLAGGWGKARFALAVAPLEDGFALDDPRVCILTERQLFPERASQPRRRKRAGREPEAIIRDLGELVDGAPVVHEDHGVGRYRGLVTLEAG